MAKKQKKPATLLLRFTPEFYQELRQWCFDRNLKIATFIREMVEKKIK